MKAVVLALSPSVALYKPDTRLKIGVNDVEKYHHVDHLIVVDREICFTNERLKTIRSSTPDLFISPCEEWSYMKNFQLIKLASFRSSVEQMDDVGIYPYSIMSPFVAIVHAYKIGATEITLYGVDINQHGTLSDSIKKERILRDINILNKFLIKKNVKLQVYNKSSLLSGILNYISND